jgi:hypothetical protein
MSYVRDEAVSIKKKKKKKNSKRTKKFISRKTLDVNFSGCVDMSAGFAVSTENTATGSLLVYLGAKNTNQGKPYANRANACGKSGLGCTDCSIASVSSHSGKTGAAKLRPADIDNKFTTNVGHVYLSKSINMGTPG